VFFGLIVVAFCTSEELLRGVESCRCQRGPYQCFYLLAEEIKRIWLGVLVYLYPSNFRSVFSGQKVVASCTSHEVLRKADGCHGTDSMSEHVDVWNDELCSTWLPFCAFAWMQLPGVFSGLNVVDDETCEEYLREVQCRRGTGGLGCVDGRAWGAGLRMAALCAWCSLPLSPPPAATLLPLDGWILWTCRAVENERSFGVKDCLESELPLDVRAWAARAVRTVHR
jgi:hypothetical protein